MEKITVVLPSTLTVPAIRGGAVEQLLDNFLRMNEENPQFQCVVVAHYIKGVEAYRKAFRYAKFRYVKMPTLLIRANSIFRNVFRLKWLPDLYDTLLVREAVKAGNKKVLLEGNARLVSKLRGSFPQAEVFAHIHADLVLAESQAELNMMNATEKIICVSEYIRKEQLKRKIHPTKAISVLNGIETDKFRPDKIADDEKSIRMQFGLPQKGKIILFKGRIVEEKGVIELLEAFSKIKREDVVLAIAGSKNFAEKRYVKSKYEKQVEQYVKKDRRVVMLGYVEYGKLPLLHKIANIAVVPSIWQEPCGLVAMEAIASGTPLIASRAGGLPEVVGEASSILIDLDKDFIGSMREAMERLLSDPALCRRIRASQLERGKALSNERYFKELCSVLHGK